MRLLVSKRYFTASAVLHLMLLIPLLLAAHGKGSGKDKDGDKDGKGGRHKQETIIPKNAPGEPEKPQEITLLILNKPKPNRGHDKESVKDCKGKNWYGGIGIEQNYMTGAISIVEPGYPAYRAGLMVGDKIQSPGEIRGLPGTKLVVLIIRAGQPLLFEIIREKICIAG